MPTKGWTSIPPTSGWEPKNVTADVALDPSGGAGCLSAAPPRPGLAWLGVSLAWMRATEICLFYDLEWPDTPSWSVKKVRGTGKRERGSCMKKEPSSHFFRGWSPFSTPVLTLVTQSSAPHARSVLLSPQTSST